MIVSTVAALAAPATAVRPEDDPRFNFWLLFDIRKTLMEHGYAEPAVGELGGFARSLFRLIYTDTAMGAMP